MPKLIAAIWSVNTKQQCSPERRMGELVAAVQAAWDEMVKKSGGQTVRPFGLVKPADKAPDEELLHKAVNNDVRYLFIAPEYLFTAARGHFMSEREQESVRAGLVFLSLRFPDLLLIPGSVGWYKTNLRSPERLFRKSALREAGSENRDLTKYAHRYKAAAETTNDYSFLKGKVLPQVESTYAEGDKALREMRQDQLACTEVLLAKSDASIRIAKNTCFVLKAATMAHRYDKSFEAFDSTDKDINKIDRAKPILLMPGKHSPVFDSQGVQYGLELCADHSAAALGLYVSKMKPVDVDVQIVMSASTEIEQAHCIARHFVLHADAQRQRSAMTNEGKAVAPFWEKRELEIFELQWE